MENKIKSRYANILLDYWFKRSFGNESGKRLMILTLREILPEVDIEDITYGNKEHPNPFPDSHGVIFDIECTSSDGSRFIVEVQLARQGSTTALTTVSVSQPARYFTLTTATVTVSHGSTGGTHQVHISTNSPWTAKSTSSWMQLSQHSGSGEQDIDVTLTTPDHPSTLSRKDTTAFTPTYGTAVTIITTQDGRYLRTDPSELSAIMPDGGTSQTVTVTTDGTFTVTSSDPSWLTVKQADATFTYTATENTTGSDREAVITVALTGLLTGEEPKVELPVMQYATSPGVTILPFTGDEQWDIVTGTGAVITVTGYGSDENWN